MDKFAEFRLRGQTDALVKLGFAAEKVAGILVNQGMTKEAADAMVKEAWGALVGGALRAAGRWLAPRAAQFARGGAARMGQGGMAGRAFGGAQQFAGRLGLRAGRGIASGGRAFQQAPIQSLGRGALEAGKGALFLGGKGLGGTVGKGLFGASMYSSLAGPGQMQMPQAYGGLARPPGQY